MPLPVGTAVELRSGQRFVLQSHYLNTSSDPIRVQDRVVVSTVPEDEVAVWAAPVIFNLDDFRIPAGQALTASFDCTVDTDLNLLYTMGHLHEWGTAFQLDMVDGATSTSFFSIPEWDPSMRDAPPVMDAVADPLPIPAGTTFETTCSWFNDTAADLQFPQEMCVTVMMAFPLRAASVCSGVSL